MRLTTGLDLATFSLSSDGRALAYSSFPNTSNIWAIPIPASGTVDEREAKQITTGTQHIEGVGVSRDGQWLAFDSDRQGNPDIYRMPVAGGEIQQVTTDPSFDFIPSWSPDGKRIVFQSWRNESRDVFAVNGDGTEERLLAGGPAMEFYADWAPDGKTVVFFSDRTGRFEIHTVRETAPGTWGEDRQLTRDGGINPRWSPDGRAIVFIGPRGLELVDPASGATWPLVNGDNADPRMAFPQFAVWSPDSKTVYFKAALDRDAAFWAVPAAGGRPRLLVRFENPAFASARQEFATDGKRIYYTADDRQSDIKVMEVRP
jgi:Tol biopolymer transport system component